MEKIKYPCPCGGIIEWKNEKVIIEDIDCGVLDIEICPKCGEKYFPEESMETVENKLKEAGLWGVPRKEVTLWKSGNSVLLRIPGDMAKKLNLKPDEKVTIYAEGKNKVIINL
ncbi:MAG: hypothetical protein AABW41_03340 [Nanoarchaeota archaeon]